MFDIQLLVCFSYELMLVCWEWDPAARPTFTELRVKLNEIFGESSSGCNLCTTLLHSIKSICSALQKPKATTQRLRMVNMPMRKMTQDQCEEPTTDSCRETLESSDNADCCGDCC